MARREAIGLGNRGRPWTQGDGLGWRGGNDLRQVAAAMLAGILVARAARRWRASTRWVGGVIGSPSRSKSQLSSSFSPDLVLVLPLGLVRRVAGGVGRARGKPLTIGSENNGGDARRAPLSS
jgi:hypothetical protein